MTTKNNKEIRENIIDLIWEWRVFCGALNPVTRKRAEKMADQILSLIPEEGEVIAEANSKVGHNSIVIYAFDYVGTMRILANFKINKEIQIIIREVKD